MAKPEKGKHTNELIHCDNCGEDYAATYRSCPFCESRPTRGRGGGSRLTTNKRGGGYGGPFNPLRLVLFLLSLILVAAAVVIVVSMLRSLLGGEPDDSTPSAPPASAAISAAPTPDVTPGPTPTPAPPASTATGITLDRTDFTMGSAGEQVQITASVIPAGATGTVVWTSSDPSVATVSDTGLVTAVSRGTVTITAAIGDVSAECIVRCPRLPEGAGGEPGAPTSSPSAGGTLTLNKTDFTIRSVDPSTVQLKASGGDGSYTWTSSDPSVATVSDTGLVTKVGAGQCTVTVTSGGQTATCIVRIS